MDITLLNGSTVAIIDNVIPDEDCKKLADYAIYVKQNNIDIENIAELDLQAESDNNIKYWKAKNLYLKFCSPEYENIGIELGNRYISIFKEYLKQIGLGSRIFDIDQLTPTVVHVYREGDTLDPHKDGKSFALVMYLNEPEEFTGGDLYYNALGIRITPKRGRLVIAPSSDTHEVLEVTSGFRCSMTVFVDILN
jgi:Rps23 Pro-64 3,4-dihydroxylase Tpa1-like proline 4-hydroxylase